MTNKETALQSIGNSDGISDPQKLIEILHETDELYTNDGESYLTDLEYDGVRLLAEKLLPTHPYFLGVGSTTRIDKVKLPYKMGSLDQVQVGELNNWVKSKKAENKIATITDKMDGISVLLVYDDNGDFQIALTRGDGFEGQDITRHVKLIPSVPMKLSGKASIRAEIEFSETAFKKIQSTVTRRDGSSFKNSRNAVAGLMNNKHINSIACENLSVIAYEIMGDVKTSKESQLMILKNNGFQTVHYVTVPFFDLTDTYLSDHIKDRKSHLDYAIDGVVVDIDDYDTRKLSTKSDSLNPEYAFKYKILDTDNIRKAMVAGVEWNISKHGYAKPKIKLEPFDLQGVTISNTTGFNAKYILDNNIGKGTIVNMTRSGDVIPYILDIVASTRAEMPQNLDDYIWSDNEVDLILKNKDTDEIKQKQLVSWATKMDIPNLKEGGVGKLFSFGYKTPSQLVRMTKSEWVSVIGKNGEKAYNGLRTVLSSIELPKLMGSHPSFGVGIGVRRIQMLLDSDPSLAQVILTGSLVKSDIQNAGGFDSKTASIVLTGYPDFLQFLTEIDGLYSVVTTKQNGVGQFVGMKICFTGFRDKELESQVENEGGTISSSVSKNTNLLVAFDTDSQSSKLVKAENLGIEIISKEEMKNRVGDVKKNVVDNTSKFFNF